MKTRKNDRMRAIADQPSFARLSRRRIWLGAILATTMATLYFAFIATVAFAPTILGLPIASGSTISLGVVFGVGLMCFGLLLTAIYVVYATTRLDPLVAELKGDFQ